MMKLNHKIKKTTAGQDEYPATGAKNNFLMNTGALHIYMRIAMVLLLTFGFAQLSYAIIGPGAAWTKVRQITLSPVTPAANYQVKVTLASGQYTNMNTLGYDLRFYDSNNNPCSYWIETWNTGGSSTIWVKVPTSGAAALFMYYGNGSILAAASNGATTFDFFDDGSSLTGWTNTGATVDGTKGLPLPSFQAVGTKYAYRDIGLTTNKILEFSGNVINGSTDLCNFYFLANASGAGQMFRLESRSGNSSGFATTTSWTLWGNPGGFGSVTANAWHSVKIVIKATTADGFIDGVAFGPNFTFANNGGYIAFHGDGATVTGGNFDNIRVRQYTASEPVATMGSEINNLTASITSQINVLCNGQSTGTATVTASGGSSPYSYLWSNTQTTQTATGLSAATFTVTVTDNIGLTTTASVTITQPATVGGSISSQTNALCKEQSNGSVTVAGSGGVSPYTYALDAGTYGASGTFSSLAASVYTVHVKDANGCIFDQAVTITQLVTVIAGVTSQSDITCFAANDGTITVSASGGASPYTFSVDNGSTWLSATGTDLRLFTGLLPNNPYRIKVKDNNGCISK